ncbi:UBX domain protein (Ubx5) [Penicillium odoratum]|uniref:UBX domain protein (Ubx5) n=1 Tax=Penicillium odoratum TaxID=1167516 RepID=UPI002548018E|nr:UBX domain protein (Ubx5) [Penicillium odoratum]KAJ5752508.1 UBX domain protein (Ubx5) [Penicillium odoratum]
MDDSVVAQFTEITGATPETATQYLQLSDFNIEHAMQLFFENGGAPMGDVAAQVRHSGYEDESGVVHIDSDSDDDRPTRSTQPGAGTTFDDDAAMARRLQEEMYGGGGPNNDDDEDDGVRAPMARTTETLVGPELDFHDGGMHSNILGQLHGGRSGRGGRGGRPGIFNQQDSASIWSGSSANPQEILSQATGGASDASSKSNMLAEMYRPPFEIMSRLPWDVARQEGRDNEKWLLVNIQDQSIFDCQVLNRDLWKDKGIQETIKEHFIFLQFSKDDPRAAPYLQYYFQASEVSDNYPHIAIVDPRTGEKVKAWTGQPVVKGPEFLMQLHEFLDRYSLNLNVRNPVAKRKLDKPEKTVDAMTEEEMLDMAMRNSLGDEAPKPDDPDDLTRSTTDIKGKGKATEDDEMGEPEPVEEAGSSLFYSIPSDQPHVEPAADPATTTRIQFRHPAGRVIRRFALTDPVQRIYEWLKADPPVEGKVGVEFDLNSLGSNLIESLQTSIESAGLKNGTVNIGYLED